MSEVPAVGVARFENARLSRRDLLVTTDSGDIVYESALNQWAVLESNGILDSILPADGARVKGSHVLLGHPWSFGYYHWLFEALPRLSLIDAIPELSELPLILPGDAKPFQLESIVRVGIDIDRLWRPSTEVSVVDRLYLPTLFAPSGVPSPKAVAWLRRAFLAAEDTQPPTGRRLYLSRSDAPQRRLLNEEEVVGYLTSVDYEVVRAGDYSFDEQVSIFAGVTHVVAPHGAAVSNMAFAPRGTQLIELFGDSYVNGCYWALASILDQPYGCVIGKSEGLDYTVSLGRLKQVMANLRG
ncbi:Capsular polysaccharide biosynthesis protein [Luteitalea pratensis]|uniref:Capsular polysaccharide biosynthesis protein n=1 Tax=Luteitalea pratensis TaxID=1855912 RepID=A0A143PX68_LUTPR|nr:glycosyltransferase family 61 protein [Luteitalea pratensis]AMY12961.1 Capsular polysaccharide biosynthesis protein [Luteitalea pratensis]